jgi:hypothetical protein
MVHTVEMYVPLKLKKHTSGDPLACLTHVFCRFSILTGYKVMLTILFHYPERQLLLTYQLFILRSY